MTAPVLDRDDKLKAYFAQLRANTNRLTFPLEIPSAVRLLRENRVGENIVRRELRAIATDKGLNVDDNIEREIRLQWPDETKPERRDGHARLSAVPNGHAEPAASPATDGEGPKTGPAFGPPLPPGSDSYGVVSAGPTTPSLPPRLDVLDAGDDDQPIPPRQWLLGNSFCRQFVSGIIGVGGAGKTSVRVLQALVLASAKPLTGEHIFRRARVLFVCLEDGLDELRRRVRAGMIYHKVGLAEVKDHLFLTTPMGLKLARYDGKKSVVAGDLDRALRAFVEEMKIDLVMVDPIKKAHGVDENDNTGMDGVITILSALAIEKNIAVDYASHEAKASGGEPGDANRARGAGAVKDGARLLYTVTTMSKDEADAFGVGEEERRSILRFDSAKLNIAPLQSARWFRLVGVPLDNGNDAYPGGDTVQVAERWTPPQKYEGLSNDDLNKALERLGAGIGDGQRYSVAASAKERAAWRVLKELFVDKTEQQCRAIITEWLKNGLLEVGTYYNPTARKDQDGILSAKAILGGNGA